MNDTSPENMQILSLVTGQHSKFEDINLKDFNEEMNKIEDLKVDEIVVDISEELELKSQNCYSLQEID